MALLIFAAEHLAILLLVLLCAAGMGAIVSRSRFTLPLRSALGLAVWGEALFLLAGIGQLKAVPVAVLAIVTGVVGCRLSVLNFPRQLTTDNRLLVLGALFALVFLLALLPPLAFDETLYHLPTVRALAASGRLRFVPDLRFPVFPQLQELLSVPLYLLAGDVATHLLALAEMTITAALLIDWGKRHGARSGWLAAAFLLGSPIVLHLATVTYVDAALTLFVTAGFYALDREEPALSGFFFGAACSVKYHGGYFAVIALVIMLVRQHGRAAARFAATCAAAALPTTLWLLIATGNPVYPFFDSRVTAPRLLSFTPPFRVLWDVTFARARVSFAPPITPLLIPAVLLVFAAAIRDRRARWVVLICGGYLAIFSFLPQDSRYLVPLLPLAGITAAATVTARWPRVAAWLFWIAIAPGFLYAAYRIRVNGLPPATPAAREELLARRIPEYRAVTHAGTGTIYVCGGEQLKYYAKGTLLGDFFGPYAYRHVLAGASDTASIAQSLRRIHAEYFLVATRVCAPPHANGGMDLVYADATAQLWRVQGSSPNLR